MEPKGVLSIDVNLLVVLLAITKVSVENEDDVEVAKSKIKEIEDKFISFYEANGEIDEFKSSLAEKLESDELYNEANSHFEKVSKRNELKMSYEIIEVTGDAESDAKQFVSKAVKIFNDINNFSDLLFAQDKYGVLIGKIAERYMEGDGDENFNTIAEKLAAEMDLEGSIEKAQGRAMESMKAFSEINLSAIVE